MSPHTVQITVTDTVECVEAVDHHHYVDTDGIHWVHPGKIEKCSAPECQQVTCGYDPMPHNCEHWRDDEQYHAAHGEKPCGQWTNTGTWL